MQPLPLLITLVLAGWTLLGLAVALLVGAAANLMPDQPGGGQ
jgi:hypothetical protein